MFGWLRDLMSHDRGSLVYSKVAEDDAHRFSLDSVTQEEHRLLEKIRNQRRSIISLLCLSAFLFVTVLGQLAYNTRETWYSSRALPQISERPVTFDKSELYASSSNPESDVAWASLVPTSKGFVSVDNAAEYDLPPGIDANQQSGNLYGIAVFHQLDCLTSLRSHLWHLSDAKSRNQTEQLHAIIPEGQEEHVSDCLDYLRQSLMCAGDMSLEYPAPMADAASRQIVSGWGVQHQCTDWDAVLRYATSNSPPSLGGQ